MSDLRSLDQRRAASAYAYAATGTADLDRAQKLPAMLQVNGLLATWAFLLAKEETTLLEALLRHLRTMSELEVPQGDPQVVFLHWVGGATGASGGVEGPRLRALTAEALGWSVWLKRAAEAVGVATGGESHA